VLVTVTLKSQFITKMYVRSRKFCCCFPVRFGVFILSLLTIVGGSFVAAIGWMRVSQLNSIDMDKGDKIALYIHSGMFSILVILGVFGFFGAIVKNRSFISSFAIALAIHLGFSVASGIFTLYTHFKQNTADAIAACVNQTTDVETQNNCPRTVSIMKGVMVGVYIITWVIQLYAYFIVERYAEQLDDENASKQTLLVVQPIQTATYGSFGPSYPFSAPPNANGVDVRGDASRHV